MDKVSLKSLSSGWKAQMTMMPRHQRGEPLALVIPLNISAVRCGQMIEKE